MGVFIRRNWPNQNMSLTLKYQTLIGVQYFQPNPILNLTPQPQPYIYTYRLLGFSQNYLSVTPLLCPPTQHIR